MQKSVLDYVYTLRKISRYSCKQFTQCIPTCHRGADWKESVGLAGWFILFMYTTWQARKPEYQFHVWLKYPRARTGAHEPGQCPNDVTRTTNRLHSYYINAGDRTVSNTFYVFRTYLKFAIQTIRHKSLLKVLYILTTTMKWVIWRTFATEKCFVLAVVQNIYKSEKTRLKQLFGIYSCPVMFVSVCVCVCQWHSIAVAFDYYRRPLVKRCSNFRKFPMKS